MAKQKYVMTIRFETADGLWDFESIRVPLPLPDYIWREINGNRVFTSPKQVSKTEPKPIVLRPYRHVGTDEDGDPVYREYFKLSPKCGGK